MSLKSRLGPAFVGGIAGAVIAAGTLLGAGALDDDDDDATRAAAVPSAAAPGSASDDGGVPATAAQVVYDDVSSGVVSIRAVNGGVEARLPIPDGEDDEDDGEEGAISSGSGFLIDDAGTVITNAHVVGRSKDVSIRFDQEAEAIDAEVVGTDPSTDIAVLRIDTDEAPDDYTPLQLADSDDVRVGQAAVAIGNPFGLDRTATAGIVSGKGREIESPNGFQIDDVIQTDAPINPGSSGGPLLDAEGDVIGVNSQILTGGSARGNVGIGFAVPANTVRDVVPRLKRDGEIERAYLGVSTLEITEEVAEALDIKQQEGALVVTVATGGPARRAGIRGSGEDGKGGDIIVEVAGTKISDPEDVADAVTAKAPGDEVEIVVLRGGQRKSISVKLGDRPKEAVE